jgi:hypothetical protein
MLTSVTAVSYDHKIVIVLASYPIKVEAKETLALQHVSAVEEK